MVAGGDSTTAAEAVDGESSNGGGTSFGSATSDLETYTVALSASESLAYPDETNSGVYLN